MASVDPLLSSFSVSSLAAQTAGLNKKKEVSTGKASKLKSKFTELLSNKETEPQVESGFPIEIASMSQEDAVAFLLDAVTLAGDKVKQSPFGGAFVEYREKVGHFIKFVVKNTYDLEKEEGSRLLKGRRRKQYSIVTIIDEKLDKLAKDILYNQRDQLNLLARIDEIKGFLVDLIL